MATLTISELRKIRNRAEAKANTTGIPIRWVKAAIHDTVQAIEDAIDGTINITRLEVPGGAGEGFNIIVSARIDAAAIPYGLTFTNAEKKWLFAFVVEQKYERDK